MKFLYLYVDDLKVSDPSVEDLLYMIDEEGREACIKLYTFLHVLRG